MDQEEIAVEEVEVLPTPELAPPSTTLFRTNDPVEVLDEAQRIADALMIKVRKAGLISNIGNKDYLVVEAWQMLGQQVGVTGVIAWTRPLDNGWEARCEARTLDGRVIGAAEAECLRAESRWKNADDFAVRSMAQTRAMSKSLASVLRFIPTLAGAQGTPAEEMPREGFKDGDGKPPPSEKQLNFLDRLLKDNQISADTRQTIGGYATHNLEGGRSGSMSATIDLVKREPDKFLPRLVAAAGKWADEFSDLPEPDTTDLPDVDPETGEILDAEDDDNIPF